MIDAIDIRDDWSCSDVVLELLRIFDTEQPTASDAVLIEPHESPRIMSRAELFAHLRLCGLYSVARRSERFYVPPRHILALVIGDAGVRRVALPLPDEHDEPTHPRAHVALGTLGLLAGQGD